MKNIELATALDYSKPSVHNMLKSLAETGVLKQEIFGLAHFTDEGRALAIKYECCFHLLETIISRYAAERGIGEDLKAHDMLRWVAEMNNIKASAEEIVLREVVLV